MCCTSQAQTSFNEIKTDAFDKLSLLPIVGSDLNLYRARSLLPTVPADRGEPRNGHDAFVQQLLAGTRRSWVHAQIPHSMLPLWRDWTLLERLPTQTASSSAFASSSASSSAHQEGAGASAHQT